MELKNIIFCAVFFALSFFGQKLFIKIAKSKQLLDIPNNRSLHSTPKPRGGGLIIYILGMFALGLAYFAQQSDVFYVLFGASTLVAMIGFKDDLSGAAISVRLVFHILAAILVSYFYIFLIGGFTNPNTTLIFLWCIALIVFCINIYNFMDGIDGICGGVAIATLFWMSVLLFLKSQLMGLTFSIILLTVVIAFLWFNWPPSKVFLGDVGSGFIGLILPALYILNFGVSFNSIGVFFILNAAFFADSLWTLFVRIIKREKFYQSHRSHAYQHASIELSSHSKVSKLYIGYTFLYTGPLATWALLKSEFLLVALLLAYLPMVKWQLKYRAGCQDLQAKNES